jgi:hypothetical protein
MKNWLDDLADICRDNTMEAMTTPDGAIILVTPKMPPENVQAKIKQTIPQSVHYEIKEGPRIVTTEGLRMFLGQAGASSVLLSTKKHTLIIEISGESPLLMEKESPLWDGLERLLKHDPFVEGYEVLVNGQVILEYNATAAKALETSKKPERDICPTEDEIMNLRITLETSNDVLDFLEKI